MTHTRAPDSLVMNANKRARRISRMLSNMKVRDLTEFMTTSTDEDTGEEYPAVYVSIPFIYSPTGLIAFLNTGELLRDPKYNKRPDVCEEDRGEIIISLDLRQNAGVHVARIVDSIVLLYERLRDDQEEKSGRV